MKYKRTRIALSSTILLTTITACGGGGGGGETTPRQQFTTLPQFLQGKETQCEFVENGTTVGLVDYSGNLSVVTELTCENVALDNLSDINLLPNLETLNLKSSTLSTTDELLNNNTILQLDLSASSLEGVDNIVTINSLINLNLENTGIADVLALSSLSNLQTLDISGNGIEDISLLGNLLSLIELDLSNNQLVDINSLNTLSNLKSLNLSGNDQLSCISIDNFESVTGGSVSIIVPESCKSVIYLTDSSAEEQIVDISTLSDPAKRIVISSITDLSDIKLFHTGDDLEIELTTQSGSKYLNLTNWFIGEEYQVAEFEVQTRGVLTFNQLQNEIGLGIKLTAESDNYGGTNNRDIVYGLSGDDIIYGNGAGDILVGGPGDDVLSDDLLVITETDGRLSFSRNTGYNQDDDSIDTFVFNAGDGNDTLYLYEFNSATDGFIQDTIQFGTDIDPTTIELYRDENDLVFKFSSTNDDSIRVKYWFTNERYRLGQIQFGLSDPINATKWVNSKPLSKLAADSNPLAGTINPESILGTTGNDIIYGLGGADTIAGGKGDDVLSDNILKISDIDGVISYSRNTGYNLDDDSVDTFVYNSGDGNDTLYLYEYTSATDGFIRDTLQFGTDIDPNTIDLYRRDNELIFKFTTEDNDSITIKNWYSGSRGSYRLGQLQFGSHEPVNATDWVNSTPVSQFVDDPNPLEGSSESNILLGTVNDDVIIALKDADIITGGKGDDVLSDNILKISDIDGVISYSRNTGYDLDDDSVDTFVYSSGDGNDTLYLYEYSSATDGFIRDTLQFGNDIDSNSIQLYRSVNDLIFEFTTEDNDSITVKNWFTGSKGSFRLGHLQFGLTEPVSATDWVNDAPVSRYLHDTSPLEGTFEANNLLGTNGGDVIIGLGGTDTITGGPGDDILSDHILNISGDEDSYTYSRNTGYNVDDDSVDTFVYNEGDGNDTLYLYEYISATDKLVGDTLLFGPNITIDDLKATIVGDDLVLTIKEAGSITIVNWFLGSKGNYQLGNIEFTENDTSYVASTLIDDLLK